MKITIGMELRRRRDDKQFILTQLLEYQYDTIVFRGSSKTFRTGIKQPYRLVSADEIVEYNTTQMMMTVFKPTEVTGDERLLPEYNI